CIGVDLLVRSRVRLRSSRKTSLIRLRRIEVRVLERVAVVLDQLKVLLAMPMQDHAERPWTRVHLRAFERRRVLDRGLVAEPPAFDAVQLVAVVVPRAMEPRPCVEADDVDGRRVALPGASGVADPDIVEIVRMLRGV